MWSIDCMECWYCSAWFLTLTPFVCEIASHLTDQIQQQRRSTEKSKECKRTRNRSFSIWHVVSVGRVGVFLLFSLVPLQLAARCHRARMSFCVCACIRWFLLWRTLNRVIFQISSQIVPFILWNIGFSLYYPHDKMLHTEIRKLFHFTHSLSRSVAKSVNVFLFSQSHLLWPLRGSVCKTESKEKNRSKRNSGENFLRPFLSSSFS